ncbi:MULTISPECIES: hypothetical protein [unclassified Paraburkholderia]|uniref:hypothetical protein n=1 Tax=unclassified Paraburkholderia TaxID=2615204 RepID=UPI00197D6D6C|nr:MULTISPECIES: hypothetical protein [unclassified Paraburkholderia]MBN3858626.1 hypothetical protein [Paraburkholderia sp. Ac-20340]
MADARRTARVRTDTQRAFELQPVRSRAWRWGMAMLWTVLASGAGAGTVAWIHHVNDAERCPVLAPDALQIRLTNAELALEQERAARDALQKSASAAQAQASALQTEVLFLRGHGAREPAR